MIVAILLMILLIALYITLFSSGAMMFSKEVSNNIFQLKTVGDWVIVGLLITSVIFTNSYLYFAIRSKEKRVTRAFGILVGIFNNEMTILSLIPLMAVGLSANPDNIQRVVSNTNYFYIASIGIMGIGIILSMYLLRDRLARNNWWLFIIAVPHILVGWTAKTDYQGFQSFVHSSDFSYKNVANMLQDTDLDLLMLNPTWFKYMAVMIFILILLIGLIMYEFVWKKTKRWRTSHK